MRNLRAGAALLVVWLGASWALAESQRLRFEWWAPDVCPSRERVLARSEELLGRPPESALAAQLELSALVAQLAEGSWHLDLRSRPEAGQMTARSVTAASCAELADAAALLLALAIDPALSADPANSAFRGEPQPPAPSSSPGALPSATLQPKSSPPPPSERHSARDRASPSIEHEPSAPPFRLRAGAALAVWSQRLPGVAPGLLAQAGASRHAGSVLATVGVFPARHACPRHSRGRKKEWQDDEAAQLGVSGVVGAGLSVVHQRQGLRFRRR